jgi:predicted ATP-binding protein involved in virulence
MFLRELTIHNLRAIKDLQMSFESPTGDTRKWTLILGENGCGKSTVLRAIALLFAGSNALPHLLGPEIDSWIHYDSEEARIAAHIVTASGETREILLRLVRGASISTLFEINKETLAQLDAALVHTDRSYLTMGYGASRRLNSDPDAAFRKPSLSALRARSVATLFSADASLEPLEAWVIDMDYRGKRRQGQKLVQRIAENLMPDVEFHGIDKEHKQLLFKTPDGITPLTQLSDGYQNVAAWCGDLLRSITETFKDYKNPLKARGLLLVDEIDLHLHPVWQRRLRSFLDHSFENLQFIVTTHSPLTVQQSGKGELYVMRRLKPQSSPSIEAFEGTPNTMMVHQLLASPIFNLDTLDSLVVQRKRKQYRALKKKSKRTEEETKKMNTLRSSLRELPDMAQGLSKHQKKQTKVLEEIKQALREGAGRKR